MSAVLESAAEAAAADFHWTTLGEIADVIGGGTPRTTDPANFEGGDIPWITPADLSGYTEKFISRGSRFITRKGLESSSARLLPAGAVLFTSRAPIGYVAIAKNPIATNQGFKSFVLNDGVLPEYVYWWLKGSKQKAESFASGTTFLELSGANAKKLPIPMVSLARQREIVAEIEKQFSRLDEAVANLKRVKANLKRYKASVLKDAVEGRLVPTETELARRDGSSFESGAQLLQRILETRRSQWQGKGKYKEPAASKTTQLPTLPEGWGAATTGELCDCIVPSRDKPKSFSGATPWLTLPDFHEDEIVISSSRIGLGLSKAEIAESKAKVVPKGSVVMSCVGRFGITAVLGEDAVINQQLHAFLPNSFLLPKYLAYALRTRVKEMTAVSTATTISYLNKENCNNVRLALPPLPEQIRIVAEVERRLSFVDGAEAEADRALLRAKGLKHSLLQNAFLPLNLK